MRKLLISVLLASLAFTAFADDAKVLPSGVLRATFANILINSDSDYDADGELQDSTEVKFDNFGAALEFGVTDKISAAIQWVPGTMFYGDIEGMDDVDFSGLADLFVGAKIQAINDGTLRVAIAPGLAVPLDSYDVVKEGDKAIDGDSYRVSSQSETESLGLGLRLYLDYQVTKDFYINLYNQTRYYLGNEKYTVYDVSTYGALYQVAMMGGATDSEARDAAADGTEKTKYEYPVYLDFELEPHYDLTLNKTASMGFGLPVDFSMNGKVTVDGSEVDDTDAYTLSVNPGLSFFYTGVFPFEVAANYNIPLMGKNDSATTMFTVKLKLFYDFY